MGTNLKTIKRKTIETVKLIDIPKIYDYRGNIAVVEKQAIPFKPNRVYYLYDIPSGAKRGGHAHKEQLEFIIPLSGSFDVIVYDGKNEKRVTMNKPDQGLFVETMIWRELENFSSGAICLVLASDVFDESDYIRDIDVFESAGH